MITLIFNITYLGHDCGGVINNRPYVYDFETIQEGFDWLRDQIKHEVLILCEKSYIRPSIASISLFCRSEYSHEDHLLETHLFNIREYKEVLYNLYGEEKTNNIIKMLKDRHDEK